MSKPNKSDHLVDEIQAKMEKIASLPQNEILVKIESGKRMIEYFTKQTSEIETRRIKLADNNYTRISLCLVVVGLICNLELSAFVKILFVLGITILIVPSIAVLVEYYKQSNFDYPWKRDRENITNQWNWFYYGNPSLSEMIFETNDIYEANNWDKYKDGLLYFINRTMDLTPQQELESVLYQQYLLQAHNAFKNQFYLQLLEIEKTYLIRMIGVVSLIVVILIMIKCL